MSILMLLILVPIVVLVAIPVLAWLRDPLGRATDAVFDAFGGPFERAAAILDEVLVGLGRALAHVQRGIQYKGDTSVPLIAEMVLAAFAASLLGVVILGDAFIAALTWAALLHRPGAQIPEPPLISYEALGGIMFAAFALGHALTYWESSGAAITPRPYHLDKSERQRAHYFATKGLVLTAAAGAAFLIYRHLSIQPTQPEPLYSILPLLIWPAVAILSVSVAWLLHGFLPVSLKSALYLLTGFAWALTWLLQRLAATIRAIIKGVGTVIRRLEDLLGVPAIEAWNYFARSVNGERPQVPIIDPDFDDAKEPSAPGVASEPTDVGRRALRAPSRAPVSAGSPPSKDGAHEEGSVGHRPLRGPLRAAVSGGGPPSKDGAHAEETVGRRRS